MTDVVSEIFQHVRLTSSVYFQRDFCGPWAMKIQNTRFAQFHVITRGTCIVECGGETHDCSAGDVLLFPHSASHMLADAANRTVISGPEVMASFAGEQPMFTNGAPTSRLVCGHFDYQAGAAHPLIADLPDLVHVKAVGMLGEGSILSVLPLILNELGADNPGQSLIVERLAEVLLIQTLRSYYGQSMQGPCFFAGLVNSQVARAISHIHREYSSRVTLSDLANSAAMSRSSFAKHFKKTTRISPIEYLAKWRMINAVKYLKTTNDPVSVVAEYVGYESAISFARAFKHEYGVTPSSFRKSG